MPFNGDRSCFLYFRGPLPLDELNILRQSVKRYHCHDPSVVLYPSQEKCNYASVKRSNGSAIIYPSLSECQTGTRQ